jgi:two-component system, OmpR family, sensor histidine kinase PrrB
VKRPLSIRARVTIAATAAVALVLVVGGILTVATFAQRERSSLDRDLEQRARGPAARAVAIVEPGLRPNQRPNQKPDRMLDPRPGYGPGRFGRDAPAPDLPGEGGGPGLLAESGAFVRVIGRGQVVEAAGDVPDDGFPLPKETGFETVEAGGHTWRTLTVEPPPPPLGAAESGARPLLQFGTDLAPVEDRIGEMRTRVLVISAIGIAIAAVLARLLSGLALEPLVRLRRGVAGISGTRDLSRRIPETDAAEEVSELTRSMNAMLTRLERSAGETEEALENTRRFAADVGHELRTPLTSIRANLDALRRNPSMPEDERRRTLEEVAREQHELVALLDALQALARGDSGAALPRERVDFAQIIDLSVEAARRRHPEATIALEGPDERQELTGWHDGLRLLIDNLIENAVRHGGSQVRVELSRDGDRSEVLLAVEDDGPGIPEGERGRIFERFTRGSAATADGSGLGLALVAQQAELHGGDVEVGDSAAGGARFAVRLPLNG